MIARAGAKWMVIDAKDVKPIGKKLQDQVAQRDAADQCVKCGKQCDGTEGNRRKLGLCPTHYGQFDYARRTRFHDDPEGLAQFQVDLIESGELLLEPLVEANDYLARAKKVKS